MVDRQHHHPMISDHVLQLLDTLHQRVLVLEGTQDRKSKPWNPAAEKHNSRKKNGNTEGILEDHTDDAIVDHPKQPKNKKDLPGTDDDERVRVNTELESTLHAIADYMRRYGYSDIKPLPVVVQIHQERYRHVGYVGGKTKTGKTVLVKDEVRNSHKHTYSIIMFENVVKLRTGHMGELLIELKRYATM